MRNPLKLIILTSFMLISTQIFALPPVVNYNVPVMQHATPAQCSNWRSQIGPEEDAVAEVTPVGGYSDFGSPGIRTCTGCSVNQSGTCICKTCYDYTDGP